MMTTRQMADKAEGNFSQRQDHPPLLDVRSQPTLCLPRHNSLPVRFILPPLASSVGTTIRRSRKIDTFPDFSLENGNSSTIPSSLQWTNIGLHSPFDRLCLLNISPVSKLLDRLFLPVLSYSKSHVARINRSGSGSTHGIIYVCSTKPSTHKSCIRYATLFY